MLPAVLILCVGCLSIVTDVAEGKTRLMPVGITLQQTASTWAEAHQECLTEGNILASPINDKALDAMKSWMGVKNTMYFIGIRSWNSEKFVSVEGVPLKNIPVAAMDMIGAVDLRDGDCLAMSKDNIRAVPCWSMLPYMCYNTRIYNTNTTNCGPREEGYIYEESQQKCYKAHVELASWVQAEQTCIAEGGHLVVLDNDNEAQVVRNLFHSGWDWITTGLYDHTSKGDWTSVHGQRVEDLYNVWSGGSKLISASYPCAMISKNMQYGYDTCDKKFPFICERAPTA